MNQSTLEVTIRQETKDDQPEVYAINTQAFGQEGEAMLVDRLRKTPSFVPELSLVATSGDRLVGHILFSIISISDGNGNKVESLALAPMAVKPEFQQQLAEARTELLQQALVVVSVLIAGAAAEAGAIFRCRGQDHPIGLAHVGRQKGPAMTGRHHDHGGHRTATGAQHSVE